MLHVITIYHTRGQWQQIQEEEYPAISHLTIHGGRLSFRYIIEWCWMLYDYVTNQLETIYKYMVYLTTYEHTCTEAYP